MDWRPKTSEELLRWEAMARAANAVSSPAMVVRGSFGLSLLVGPERGRAARDLDLIYLGDAVALSSEVRDWAPRLRDARLLLLDSVLVHEGTLPGIDPPVHRILVEDSSAKAGPRFIVDLSAQPGSSPDAVISSSTGEALQVAAPAYMLATKHDRATLLRSGPNRHWRDLLDLLVLTSELPVSGADLDAELRRLSAQRFRTGDYSSRVPRTEKWWSREWEDYVLCHLRGGPSWSDAEAFSSQFWAWLAVDAASRVQSRWVPSVGWVS